MFGIRLLRACMAVLSFLAFATGLNAQSRIFYVEVNGTDDASSWTRAGNLQSVLAQARPGDEIWLGKGTYKPVQCNPCDEVDRESHFRIPSGVRLRGGFSGELRPEDRRRGPNSFNTILSGRIDAQTRVLNLVHIPDAGPGTLLENIRFEDALADRDSIGFTNRQAAGALLYVSSPTGIQLEIRDCAFVGGEALGDGAAVYVYSQHARQAEVQVSGCQFLSNDSRGGSGLCIDASYGGNCAAVVESCSFLLNKGGLDGGAGLLLRAREGGFASLEASNLIFQNNQAPEGPGGAVLLDFDAGQGNCNLSQLSFRENTGRFGGGLCMKADHNGLLDASLDRLHFESNRSTNAGGALYTDASSSGDLYFHLRNSRFLSNTCAESGGAIYINTFEGSSSPRLENVEIISNRADLYGGGLYLFGRAGIAHPLLLQCVFARNQALSAGGMYCLGSSGGRVEPMLLNCAFVENQASIGGGLYANANDSSGLSRPRVINTIFQGNTAPTAPTIRSIWGEPLLYHCSFDVSDCQALYSGVGPGPSCISGNLFGQPDQFKGIADNDFKLRNSAASINQGRARELDSLGITADLLGRPRNRNGAFDIGPIEHFLTQSAAINIQKLSHRDCVGSPLQLQAEVEADFNYESRWYHGAQLLGSASALSIQSLANQDSGWYRFEIHAGGEAISDSLYINVQERVAAEVSHNRSSLPDTLSAQTTYRLELNISPAVDSAHVVWTDVNTQELLGFGESLQIYEEQAGLLSLKASVDFANACTDREVIDLWFDFPVKLAGSSTRDASREKFFTILSNPVQNQLEVETKVIQPSKYHISGLDGRKWLVGTLFDQHSSIDVTRLPAGAYQFSVQNTDGVHTGLFLKL